MVAAARALLGVPFRVQGRDAGYGLDCVGLVALATGRDAPGGYALRFGDAAAAGDMLTAAGLARADARLPGDVLLLGSGPGQLHLAIWTGDGIVHADAGLRRVVERPGEAPWPVMGCWRGMQLF